MTLDGLLRRCAAVLSAGAGVIHLAAAGDHTEHPWAAGFFVVVGCLQLAWAGLAIGRATPRWLLVGAVGSLAVVGVWLVSRTVGVPFGLDGDGVEPLGVADTVATLLEVVLAGAAGLAAVLPVAAATTAVHPRLSERATAVVGALVVALLVPALVVSPAGHHGGHDAGAGALAGHRHAGDDHGAGSHGVAASPVHAHGEGPSVAGVQHAHAAPGVGSTAAAHGHTGGADTMGQHAPHADHDAAAAGHQGHDDGACRPTAEQQAEADALVAATARGLEKYRNHEAAMVDGYVPYPPVPAGWAQHYVDFAALEDDSVLDPERPESLLYALTDDGYRPISALYIMSHAGEEPPDVGGCLLHWHQHDELFLSRPGEQGSPVMLHVFVVPMEGGPFAHEPDPRSVREQWQPFRDYVNPWWEDSCFGLPVLPGDPFGSLPFCDSGDH